MLSRRLYALALGLLPEDFRRRYGAEMAATFDALLHEAAQRSHLAVLALVARELCNVGAAALRMRRQARHDSRSTERGRFMSGFGIDVGYALRTLRRQPLFATVALLTLALGIGATTAVFTVVDGVLLRPLPYRDPDRLVVLLNGKSGSLHPWFSPLNYEDATSESGVFEQAAAFSPTTTNLTGLGDPERLAAARVSWNFFSVLGVSFVRGRGFVPADAPESGAAPVAIVSEGLWRRRMGGRDDVVGATVAIDGQPLTVIGVAPGDVALPRGTELWLPLVFTPRQLEPRQRGAMWVSAIARLKPDVSVLQASGALAGVYARLATAYPKTNGNLVAAVVPLHERLVRNVRPALLVLLGAVGFVLLIACANVANLLLGRAQARGREVAVRIALGAGRRRVVRQLLTESLVLAALGALGGLALASLGVRALVLAAPASLPRIGDVAIDLRVLAFTVAVAAATSVLFGMAPALATSGGALAGFLKSAGRGHVSAGGRGRRGLAVGELALALMLLVGAGLLIRSYQRLSSVDPGFDPERVLSFSLALPTSKYPDLSSIRTTVATLVERLQAQPGVLSAAGAFGLPFHSDFGASSSFRRAGEVDSADAPSAAMRIVTPDYFKTMRIPLRRGRLFEASDDERGAQVVILNERAARRYWPDRDPIGQQIHVSVSLVRGPSVRDRTIVGIVGDVKWGGLDEETPAELYLPHAQHPVDGLAIAVRTSGEPLAAAPLLRRTLAALDPELPLADVRAMSAAIGGSVAERRFTMLLLASFAAIALALCAIGVYGVLAYAVSQRTQEIGVRLAIGAAPRDIVALFVREGAALAALGLGIGLLGAFAATRVLTKLLFEVTPTDPATFLAVAAALAGVALLASYLPARRAARVDPTEALRSE